MEYQGKYWKSAWCLPNIKLRRKGNIIISFIWFINNSKSIKITAFNIGDTVSPYNVLLMTNVLTITKVVMVHRFLLFASQNMPSQYNSLGHREKYEFYMFRDISIMDLFNWFF
jgi:hypothetical protein